MSDKCPKLKLKRKKCAAQECSFVTERKAPRQSASQAGHAGAAASTMPAAHDAWWDKADLPGMQQLWASVLKAAVPQLGQDIWKAVPVLPAAPPPKPSDGESAGGRWCCPLADEVPPFPPAVNPHVRPVTNTDICTPSSPLRPADPGPDPRKDGSARRACDPAGRQVRGGEMAGGGVRLDTAMGRRPPALRETAAAVGGSPGTAGAAAGERYSCGMTESGPETIPTGLRNESECLGADGNLRGAAGLASCPLCTMAFPAGFSQMDCDGHLAKCLSEMNEDVTW
ncbi:uncharacterized protein [Paramormyrops kingsleyae]|uniref:uncharacterized protein si:ch73-70k4.1 n=1 Tax=Paramormyrops kingsleyae TaxID=1676925 RepID=UPI000CD5E0B0|nr:Fanconi anemia core complex-associated protein 20 [Paramormyrops kingsleyae]